MIVSNYLEDNEDLQFVLKHCVDWERIIPLKEYDFRDAQEYQKTKDPRYELAPSSVAEALDAYFSALEQVGEIAGKELAPRAKSMEREGLRFHDGKVDFPKDMLHVIDLLAQSGVLMYSTHRQWGGLQFPYAAQMAILEMISRADAAFGIAVGCFNLADVIERFASQELKEKYLPKMHAAEMTGAMALTEPNYGSDLQNIKTRATKQADGRWVINGTKRFITHGCGIGDRPAAILTLARTGGEGGRGLSFFLVESSHVQVARIEEKLGLHISPTCEIIYENTPAYLIGEEGKGLVKYAMDMMNGARLGIAVQALGIAEAAYREGEKYARERIQFGRPIYEIPPVRRSINEAEALVQAMRALVYRTAEIVDTYDGLGQKYLLAGEDEKTVRRREDVQRYEKLSRLLTPTAKYFCSEMCNKVAYDMLQVFGGSGYTEEYDIAKIYRDARITTIYEGTSNMQVLAAIGPIVEGARSGGLVYSYLEELKAKQEESLKESFTQAIETLVRLVSLYKEKEKEAREALSVELVNYFAFLICGLLLGEQLSLCQRKASDYYPKKKAVVKSYLVLMHKNLAAAKAVLETYHG
ncbi:MAG: acyl-CoA dehydrogenase family protein [Leptospiraceae bacterium]|nr:acyl-CoA dehydrogenase family protein [Leptospiraceae bacterium]MDW8307460.1 acyl-CoA dehydrogenase family protein [Leptospiraceae bacterium]